MEGNDSFRLVVRRGPQPNQTYDLNKDIITLGRDITNDIVINDPEVSRHHLRLTRGTGGFTIEDLGSTNGTFINGQRLSGARPLANGDMIGLGETVTLGYERARGAAGPPGPSVASTAPSPAPQQQQPSPYQPPTPSPDRPPAQQQYTPPEQQQYAAPQQQQYTPPPSYATPQPPPGAGYEYDPYAVREEEPSSTMRWVVIGCLGLTFICCCGSIAGLVVIDAANLWYDIPIIRDIAPLFEQIARALGLV